jgi:hypothetical protein
MRRSLGASAVIAGRYDDAGVFKVLCYGTAVQVERA